MGIVRFENFFLFRFAFSFCLLFNLKIFQGNRDRYTVATEGIAPPIIAQYVRLKPKTWNGAICMRIEFYGCTEGKRALPVVTYDGILIN